MVYSQAQDLYLTCAQFLEKDPDQRLQALQEMGLARYDFLTKISLNDANITCVMRFLGNRQRVKFPNLKGADLSGLVLDGVNFIRGDLTGANLRGTRLVNADLLFANFTQADLRNANLKGATINETIWLEALVDGCDFGTGTGLSHEQRINLKNRGAKFSRQ